MSKNVYEMVTERIIAELQKGRIPWQKPWTGTVAGAYSRSTGKPYSLINQMILGKPGEYLTFKQVQEAGGKVKKGETANIVVFWKQLPITEKDDEGNEIKKMVPFLKYYNVFHIDQCTGIEPKYSKPITADNTPIETAEQIINAYVDRESDLTFNPEQSDRAFYRPSTDEVVVPMLSQFAEVEEYYSTAFHELTHSTMHPDRCNRKGELKVAAFGSEDYSKEELVAEIGAASLVNICGIETEKSFRNSAAYIQSWIRALRNDTRLIVSAASKAEKAVNYILGTEQ